MTWTSGYTDTSYLKLNPVFIQIMSPTGFKDFTMLKLGILGHQEEDQKYMRLRQQINWRAPEWPTRESPWIVIDKVKLRTAPRNDDVHHVLVNIVSPLSPNSWKC